MAKTRGGGGFKSGGGGVLMISFLRGGKRKSFTFRARLKIGRCKSQSSVDERGCRVSRREKFEKTLPVISDEGGGGVKKGHDALGGRGGGKARLRFNGSCP